MVSAITATTSTHHQPNPKQQQQQQTNQTRSPLLPSERDNGGGSHSLSKRPKPKGTVSSRYMSSSSSSTPSRRYPSPSPRSSTTTTPLRRSQSVERLTPTTPRPTTPKPSNAASKLLLSSTRSLSVSFQGESYSLPISKVKTPSNVKRAPTPTPERRKAVATPPRRGNGENSKPIEQHRWPGRSRPGNIINSNNNIALTRSLDCTVENKSNKIVGSASVSKALKQSMIDLDRRASLDARLNPKFGKSEISKTVQLAIIGGSDDAVMSDTESVSSGTNSESGIAQGRTAPRGISVPARFWQETNSRLRRLQDPGSPLSRSPGSKTPTQSKFTPLKKTLSDVPLSSSPKNVQMSRTMSSPMRGPSRPSSPSRLMVQNAFSPARGSPSPSRTWNGPVTGSSPKSSTPSILSFITDSQRGKMGENRIVDAHVLRLLYNRHLQWRFINARADAVQFLKKLTVERNLYNASITTSELHDSITIKRIKLQLLRQNLKLFSILKGQMTYFKEWALLDRDYSSSLSGAVEALQASTLRLPVVSGARAEIQNVMDAIGSALSVMQAMVSSLCSVLTKVEEVNSLMAELATATAEERALLAQCSNRLSMLSAMQVKDCSLRTHILQLIRVSTRS